MISILFYIKIYILKGNEGCDGGLMSQGKRYNKFCE